MFTSGACAVYQRKSQLVQCLRRTVSYGPSTVFLVVTTCTRNDPHLGHFNVAADWDEGLE